MVHNCRAQLRAVQIALGPSRGFLRFAPELVRKTKASLSSYLAHFAPADSRKLANSIFRRFRFAGEFMRHFHLIEPHYFPSAQKQFEFFKRELAGEPSVLFFQLGCRFRFFGEDAADAGKLLGLKVVRRGGSRCADFPIRMERKYAGIAARGGRRVYVVSQLAGGGFSSRQKVRVLTKTYYSSAPPAPSTEATASNP